MTLRTARLAESSLTGRVYVATRWRPLVGDAFEIIGGDRSRLDVTEDYRRHEAAIITRVLASLVDAAERENNPDVLAWLRNRVVRGRDWKGPVRGNVDLEG